MDFTEKKMKILKNKKAIAPLWLLGWVITGVVIFSGGFAATGILKFLLSDKTPLILGGLLLFIILLGKRR